MVTLCGKKLKENNDKKFRKAAEKKKKNLQHRKDI